MSDTSRTPAAFPVEDKSGSAVNATGPRLPAAFPETIAEKADDPFSGEPVIEGTPDIARPGWGWAGVALSAFGIILSLAFGLWFDALVNDLFARAPVLGWVALAALGLLVLALFAIALKEIAGMRRLGLAHDLRQAADHARTAPLPAPARAMVARLIKHLGSRPEVSRGVDRIAATENEIIDAAGLIDMAERELLGPLDRRARGAIVASARRVSIVTAVSPRAVVDLAFVLFESARLVRAVAEIYGARPGRLGFLRLFRDVIAHLAVTGSIAVGDSLVQQVLGHGLAAKLSARLGEGVINGLMTARIGIAAMDYCRPLPFSALPRPGVGDMMGELAQRQQD